jgi:asparagine N-glycosylation enzyme membrane subunit Stt3
MSIVNVVFAIAVIAIVFVINLRVWDHFFRWEDS